MNLVERLRDPMQFTWEMRNEAADRIEELQEQVKELENHNKDKSQLLANYKEQIKELVKQKYRGEK